MGMQSLNIAFNARTLSDPRLRGWSRYTINLLRGLLDYPAHFYLMTNRPLSGHFLARLPQERFTVCLDTRGPYLFWEQVVLPWRCRKHEIDVLHCPVNYGLPVNSPCPTVLTLHDAIQEVFDRPSLSFSERVRPAALKVDLLNRLSRRYADRIVTVSRHAKSDLVSRLNIPEEKVQVIYEAADAVFREKPSKGRIADTLARLKIPSPYFFYIGGLEKRKNIRFLLEAFSRSDVQASLAIGGGGEKEIARLKNEYPDERIRFLGWVEDEDLPALYAGAKAFVYPSLYEGFGLQICEAMSLGCPVLASDRTSLPEIVGDGGWTFALNDPSQLAGYLRRLASDPSVYVELSRKALERSAAFDWKLTAERTWKVYRDLCGK